MSNQETSMDSEAGALRLELYKSLKKEASASVEKAPQFWLQKLLLIGAITTFLITKTHSALVAPELIIAAIPILATLLDAKIFEYALHAKLISNYIAKRFADVPLVSDWEKVTWEGDVDPGESHFVKYRNLITVFVTIVPTMLIIFLAAGLLDVIVPSEDTFIFRIVGAVICVIYAATGWFAWSLMYSPKSRIPDADKAD